MALAPIRLRRSRQLAAWALTGVLVAAAGCGRNHDTGRLDDAAFCEQIASLRAAADGDDEPTAADLEQLRSLARQAPDDGVHSAIETILPAIERLSQLDEDDPAAFEAILELVFSPEYLTAADTLESYAVDTCGLAPSDPTDEQGGEPGETTGSPTGDAFDDLDAGELRSQLRDTIDELAPDDQGSSVLITSAPDLDGILVALDVTAPSSLDGVGLCEALAAAVDAATTDPSVVVEVQRDGEVVARRLPGGSCTAA